MSEWWTYRLGSFLMFSATTWESMVATYNRELWPGQALALGLGLWALAIAWRARAPSHDRLVSALLGGAWIWVGWAFLSRRFATVNWPAEYLGWAFFLQGAALLWLGAARGGIAFGHADRRVPEGARAVGWALAFAAIAGVPWLAPLLGKSWSQSQVFGFMPDPTAISTLGFLLMARRAPGWLSVIPVLACAASGATLWALQAPEAWVPVAAATIAVCALVILRRGRSDARSVGAL